MSSRVVVVGDLMLDRRLEGDVTRISPEAPTPVVRTTGITDAAGGAANVAINLAAMGVPTTLVGAVGEDANGRRLHQLLCEAQAKYPLVANIVSLPTCQTIVKTRITSQGRQLLRVDDESSYAPAVEQVLAVLRQVVQQVQPTTVVVSDYAKGTLSQGFLLQLGLSATTEVFVDAKPQRFSDYAGLPVTLTPNMAEAVTFLTEVSPSLVFPGFPANGPDCDATLAAAAIRRQLACKRVIVTCGKHGAALSTADGDEHVETRAVEVADPVGAGDTFLAALTASRVQCPSDPFVTSMITANRAAGLAVRQFGTVVVTRGMLDEATYEEALPESKLMSLTQLHGWRTWVGAQPGLIGLTNGCFDLLHPGHMHALQQARQYCNKLVVAYASDAGVRRLKGDSRPIVPGALRARMLLPFADAVVEADDIPGLLRVLRPDVYMKGAEYASAALAEADIVARVGGEVIYTEMLPGYSTTGILGMK